MLRDTVATAAIVAVIVAGCSFDLSVTSDGGTDDVMDIDTLKLSSVARFLYKAEMAMAVHDLQQEEIDEIN